jgi:hypothetical protein
MVARNCALAARRTQLRLACADPLGDDSHCIADRQFGPGINRWCCRIAPVDDLQCKRGPKLCQFDGDGGHGWRGTMLDRQREIIAVAAQ